MNKIQFLLYFLFLSFVNSKKSFLFYSFPSKLKLNSLQKEQKNKIKEVDVLIIGGGLCGTTAAYYLNKSNINILLVEEKDLIGGCISTRSDNEYLWEEGANSFQPNEDFLKFLSDIDLLDELVLANQSLPRYIYWNNQLHPLPSSLSQFYHSKLLSWKGKLSMILGLLGFVGSKPSHEESIKDFSIRHFGNEVYYRIIEPFVSGVYAGDPSQLSVDAAFKKLSQLEKLGYTRSLLEGGFALMRKKSKERRMKRKLDLNLNTNEINSNEKQLPKIPPGSLGSLKNGIQSIPLQIQSLLKSKVQTSSKVEKIRMSGFGTNRRWLSQIKQNNQTFDIKSKAILLTVPSYTAASILSTHEPNLKQSKLSMTKLIDSLQKIYYPPIVGVWTVYPDDAFKVKLDGFGHLIPRTTNVRTLGSIWASTLFQNRAPKGQNILVNFIGGSFDSNITALSNDEIISEVYNDHQKILLKPSYSNPPSILNVKRWVKSIPQYDLNYTVNSQNILNEAKKFNGLYFGGNYISGVSVGDCIQYGKNIAVTICEYLKK